MKHEGADLLVKHDFSYWGDMGNFTHLSLNLRQSRAGVLILRGRGGVTPLGCPLGKSPHGLSKS